MTDRMYRALLGGLLLIALAFDLNILMYALIVTLLVEGLTNWRIPLLVDKMRGIQRMPSNQRALGTCRFRFEFEAERAWRLLVGMLLGSGFIFLYQTLWFIPWFMAFAIIGAGASGICPMEFSLKCIGFR